ncbi:MAG TPA: hypothetical protein VGK19_05345 [Capsulimonadaceae bacterium]|jgi:hypothetical protein
MANNDYSFISRWRVKGRIDDVGAIFVDPADLPRWWPSVYRSVSVETPPGTDSPVYSIVTRAWLPYSLHWRFKVNSANAPHHYVLEAVDDLTGAGEWTIQQDGDYVSLVYDWRVQARKPLLRALSGVFRPLFVANHRWAMARGEESLVRELRRIELGGDESMLPPPPQPMTAAQSWSMMLLVIASLVLPGTLLLRFVKPRNGSNVEGAP